MFYVLDSESCSLCSDEVFPKALYSSTLERNEGDQGESAFRRGREVKMLPGGCSKSSKHREGL